MLITLAFIALLLLTDLGRYFILLVVGILVNIMTSLFTTFVGAVLVGWILSKLLC